jgi:hypothetical protein
LVDEAYHDAEQRKPLPSDRPRGLRGVMTRPVGNDRFALRTPPP